MVFNESNYIEEKKTKNNNRYSNLKGLLLGGLVLLVIGSPYTAEFLLQPKGVSVGEDYFVFRRGKRTIIAHGQNIIRKLYYDDNSDGLLDHVAQVTPVGPMQGGPGYLPFTTEMTHEDITNFSHGIQLYKIFTGKQKAIRKIN